MVTSVLGVNKGLRDWIIQRVSAILMAIYFVGLLIFIFTHSELSYAEWHTLFSRNWMKVASALVLLAIIYHAWVGVWTIFTDYVKCSWLRMILNLLVLFTLAACFFWGLLILWSV